MTRKTLHSRLFVAAASAGAVLFLGAADALEKRPGTKPGEIVVPDRQDAPKQSGEHAVKGQGDAVALPLVGGAGPKIEEVIQPPPDRSLRKRTLEELQASYRKALIERLHVFPHTIAEQYADAEIGALKKRFEGKDKALREALIVRLDPRLARVGKSAAKSPYPPDPEDKQFGTEGKP